MNQESMLVQDMKKNGPKEHVSSGVENEWTKSAFWFRS